MASGVEHPVAGKGVDARGHNDIKVVNFANIAATAVDLLCASRFTPNWIRRRKTVKPLGKKLIAMGRTFGPYLAIELVMPGGSLLAVLLWLYRLSCARRSNFHVTP